MLAVDFTFNKLSKFETTVRLMIARLLQLLKEKEAVDEGRIKLL